MTINEADQKQDEFNTVLNVLSETLQEIKNIFGQKMSC